MNQNVAKWWFMVEFELDPKDEEMASWLMIHKLGANGCQISSDSEGKSTLQASFEPDRLSESDLNRVNAALDEYGLGRSIGSLRTRKIEQEDWLAEWKKGFQPLPSGDRLLVCPPWLRDDLTDEQRKRTCILIEPGLAFGTGFHATTQFCLRAVENLRDRKTILDVGTGSGILAIAAALLYPECQITAVEIDPEACRVARENLALNNVSNQIELIDGEIERLQGRKFDAILSNLTCEDNIALIPQYLELIEPSACIIMSGILLEKCPRMKNAIEQNGLTIVKEETENGWAGLIVEPAENS